MEPQGMTQQSAARSDIDVRAHAMTSEEVEEALRTGSGGLSADEASRRLEQDGPNLLGQEEETSALTHLLNQFRSPLIYILVVAAVVTAVLGEYVDTGVIVAVLAINAAIGFVQERKAERSVRALMELAAPQASVVRGGERSRVDSVDLVVGDLVVLEGGDKVPADIRVAEVAGLAADESLLTGESEPARKSADPVDAESVAADRTSMVFMGTTISQGRARGYVTATAERSELGKISEQMRGQEERQTPLQQRMGRFANLIAVAVLASSAAAVLIGLALGREPGEMFFIAVALAVAVVPEGLPVVFTVALALGVRRMAHRRAIIRRLPAVETLGSTNTIGSDKTGTLTQNRMTVRAFWSNGRPARLDETDEADDAARQVTTDAHPLRLMLETGVLTNDAEVRHGADGPVTRGDPTELALIHAAESMHIDVAGLRDKHTIRFDRPFDPARLYSSTVREHGGELVQHVKGAPERVLDLCTSTATTDGAAPLDVDAVLAANEDMTRRGLRVLGMARRTIPDGHAAGERPGNDGPDPEDLEFLGLQGMLDPPREQVPEAVASCRQAGIDVVMITGDHAETARSIAADIGLADRDSEVLTGVELERMEQDELERRVLEVPVFARVSPEHKLRVVQALQANDRVVAVTGDGVNDAPALKAADIGIAMGDSGTDVAREASDMVLTDDNFVSIHAAVEEGRVTFDNIRKVTFFLVSTGAAAIVAIIASLLLGLPMPYVPAQLLWLNLVTNGLQDLALAFEPGEPDVLDRPPRSPHEGVVSALLWERSALTGVVMATGSLGLFAWARQAGHALPYARTVAITTLVVFMAFHVFNARSERRSVLRTNPLSNRFLLIAQVGALIVHSSALHVPFFQTVLRVEPIDGIWWLRIAVVGSSVIAVSELHKLLRR
jgi:calcium-translocating P-type ATPase